MRQHSRTTQKNAHAGPRIGGGAVRAELSGSDTCTALGITVKTPAPVLELSKALIKCGIDPATPLDAYRGKILCLKVRSIGEAARLRTATHGVGFEPLPECTSAPPIAKRRRALTPPATKNARDARVPCAIANGERRRSSSNEVAQKKRLNSRQ